MDIGVFLYIDNELVYTEVNENTWNELPHGIVKVYNGNVETFGWASYFIENNRICGIHQIGTNTPLEDLIGKDFTDLKFGITMPDEEWKEFNK